MIMVLKQEIKRKPYSSMLKANKQLNRSKRTLKHTGGQNGGIWCERNKGIEVENPN